MVLLTDGENNRGAVDPRTAAKAAAAFNIVGQVVAGLVGVWAGYVVTH